MGLALAGSYGCLSLNADGSYTYVVNDNNPAVQALNVGISLSETFTYTVQDTGGLTDTAQLTVAINGANDAPVITSNGGGDTASVSISRIRRQ